MQKGILVVVSGFSGAGKGTVMNRLVESHDNYALSISATSRQPRPSEKEGVNYFFKTREEFEAMISRDELIEYAEYVGNYYGTPKSFVEKKLNEGKNVLLEIEIQGAMKVKSTFPEAILIFIMPPSAEELKQRLVGRSTESAEEIDRRMKRAVQESQGIEYYDFILVNDEVDKCVSRLHGIVEAVSCTSRRQAGFIEKIRQELKEMAGGSD